MRPKRAHSSLATWARARPLSGSQASVARRPCSRCGRRRRGGRWRRSRRGRRARRGRAEAGGPFSEAAVFPNTGGRGRRDWSDAGGRGRPPLPIAGSGRLDAGRGRPDAGRGRIVMVGRAVLGAPCARGRGRRIQARRRGRARGGRRSGRRARPRRNCRRCRGSAQGRRRRRAGGREAAVRSRREGRAPARPCPCRRPLVVLFSMPGTE